MGRRLGQHFLKKESILRRVAEAACPGEEDLVIEIGPGRGALTRFLLPRTRRLVAIEADRHLAACLADKYAGEGKLEIVAGDVLETDLGQWGPAVVAGNLPYYITSPVLRRTLELGEKLRRAVFLVQKEVALRLAASPGCREYGLLTVTTQSQAEVAILFHVPPSAFAPPPKVDSSVVRLVPRPHELGRPLGMPEFLAFLQACFRQKRKTLRNNLALLYPRRLLEGIPETLKRAEQLTLEDFAMLYRRLRAGS